ncbi:MAG: hypothetical protein ACT4PT_13850 [Methanobacteriota archaeon]
MDPRVLLAAAILSTTAIAGLAESATRCTPLDLVPVACAQASVYGSPSPGTWSGYAWGSALLSYGRVIFTLYTNVYPYPSATTSCTFGPTDPGSGCLTPVARIQTTSRCAVGRTDVYATGTPNGGNWQLLATATQTSSGC